MTTRAGLEIIGCILLAALIAGGLFVAASLPTAEALDKYEYCQQSFDTYICKFKPGVKP